MTMHEEPYTEEQLRRVEAKLQAFYDGLAPDEQPAVRALLRRAAGTDDVAGYGLFDIPLTIGGKTVTISPSGGGTGTDRNAGKDGVVVAAQPGGQPAPKTSTLGITIRF